MKLDEAIKSADAVTKAAFAKAARGECAWICPDCCVVFPDGMPDACAHGLPDCTACLMRDKEAAAHERGAAE